MNEDTQSIADKIADFLSGLWGATTSGIQSTADAAVSDWERIKQGRAPNKAIEAIGQAIGAYQPATGLRPTVPANTLMRKTFDSRTGWGQTPMDHPSVDPLISLLMSGKQGSMRDWILRALREQERMQP